MSGDSPEMNVVPSDLRLSAQRALLGAIHPEVRLVKVKFDGSKILLTTIADRPLSEECAEAMSVAAAEIVSDFPECDLDEQVIISRGELPKEGSLSEGWVYQRAEP
jgi:hypothetical protein